jgi:hypothetical protein
MITGEGPSPSPNGVPRFSHTDFFADGEGWDILVIQDRADIIKDWVQFEANSAKMNESLEALDTLASWVKTAASKMRRRPSVLLFHRCLWGYNELAQISDTAAKCRKGREGIDVYLRRLSSGLGSGVPVHILPACEAFCRIHKEGPDVLRQLYAGDKEHPSRVGTYLMALLFYKLLTGRSPMHAPEVRPQDDNSRLHADMWDLPEQWRASDLWQRHAWPRWSLPEVNDELDLRLRMWAHSILPNPGGLNSMSAVPYSHDMAKQMHAAYQRNSDGPCLALPQAKTFGSGHTDKQPLMTPYLTPCGVESSTQMVFPQTFRLNPCILNSATGLKHRSMTW